MRTLVILLIIAGAGYWWNYRNERYKQFESLQSDIKRHENALAEHRKNIDRVTATLEPLRKNRDQAQSPDGSPEELEKEVEALREAMRTGLARLDAAQTEYEAALDVVRDEARKETFPELKLANVDTVLKNCTITKFGEGFISISHADGITKVQSEDLPEGWAEKFATDYVSRESKAEKEALASKVDEATIPPLDLKKAQIGEIDARIAELDTKLLALSAEIREATRKADQLVRAAYRVAMEKGRSGDAAAAKKSGLLAQSKAVEAAREDVRKKYIALRQQKLELEKRRVEIQKKKVTAVP